MNLVDQTQLSVFESEFVLCVDEDQPVALGHLASSRIEPTGELFDFGIVVGGNQTPGDDLLSGDILVMALLSMRRRGYYGLGEFDRSL